MPLAKLFVRTNWFTGLTKGRPIVDPKTVATIGQVVYPPCPTLRRRPTMQSGVFFLEYVPAQVAQSRR